MRLSKCLVDLVAANISPRLGIPMVAHVSTMLKLPLHIIQLILYANSSIGVIANHTNPHHNVTLTALQFLNSPLKICLPFIHSLLNRPAISFFLSPHRNKGRRGHGASLLALSS